MQWKRPKCVLCTLSTSCSMSLTYINPSDSHLHVTKLLKTAIQLLCLHRRSVGQWINLWSSMLNMHWDEHASSYIIGSVFWVQDEMWPWSWEGGVVLRTICNMCVTGSIWSCWRMVPKIQCHSMQVSQCLHHTNSLLWHSHQVFQGDLGGSRKWSL
jgi:hypothetical protein